MYYYIETDELTRDDESKFDKMQAIIHYMHI